MALKGIKVLEISGLAPAPFCGMLLAEFGASVVRVDKLPPESDMDILAAGKKSVCINLKSKEGAGIFKKITKTADVLIEPFRPGVMERLGLGPDELLRENSRLIYARLSGYGQTGKRSKLGGHDINYASIAGSLSLLADRGKFLPPYVGDFTGGGLLCAFGIVCALMERTESGKGQVIDAGMTAGAAYTCSWLFRSRDLGLWEKEKGNNLFDGGFHFYNVYETKDNKFISIGALEGKFYEQFLNGLGLALDDLPQYLENNEEAIKRISEIIKSKTQEEWLQIFESKDACVTAVNSIEEAVKDNPDGYVKLSSGNWAPRPSPVLSRTPAESLAQDSLPEAGEHTVDLLKEIGITESEIDQHINSGAILASKL